METFGETVAETIRDEFSCIPYYCEERDGGAEYDDGSIFILKFSIVCGETTEPELNPTLTKLVTKLASTTMSEGYGKATDVLYWLSIFYKPSYPLLLLF